MRYSQKAVIISLNSNKQAVSVMEMSCAFCEEGAEFLNIISTNFRLQSVCQGYNLLNF
jgi:hypothetical protein